MSKTGERICSSVLDLYQVSPLIRLNAVPKLHDIKCEVVAKCEFYAGVYGAKELGFKDNSFTLPNSKARMVRNVQRQVGDKLDVVVRFRAEDSASTAQSGQRKVTFPATVDVLTLNSIDSSSSNGLKKVLSEQSVQVSEKEAVDMVKQVVMREAILCGISSGAALAAAAKVIKDLDRDKRVVVLFEDGLLPTGFNVPGSHQRLIDDQEEQLDTAISGKELKEPRKSPSGGVNWRWYESIRVEQIVTTRGLVTVTEEDSLGHAVRVMNREKLHYLPVVSSGSGNFLGVVSSSAIMEEIVAETMSLESRTDKVLAREFPRVDKTDDLSLLVELLAIHPYVAIVEKLGSGCPGAEIVSMVVTPIELLTFYKSVINRCGK